VNKYLHTVASGWAFIIIKYCSLYRSDLLLGSSSNHGFAVKEVLVWTLLRKYNDVSVPV